MTSPPRPRHADRYRNPVLADAILASMMEPIPRSAVTTDRPWAVGPHEPGSRERNIVNSLWVDFDVMEAVNLRIAERYRQATEEITAWEEFGADEPAVVLCAYGISARICETAVTRAEEEGLALRLVRPKTVFPFPYAAYAAWADRVRGMLVVEMSMGQFIEDIQLAVQGRCPVELLGRAGGHMMTVDDVVTRARSCAEVKRDGD